MRTKTAIYTGREKREKVINKRRAKALRKETAKCEEEV